MFKKCEVCGERFDTSDLETDEEGFVLQDKLCYECFEEALERFEERRRERIARDNEY